MTADANSPDGTPLRPGRVRAGTFRARPRFVRPTVLNAVLLVLVIVPLPRWALDAWIRGVYPTLERVQAGWLANYPTINVELVILVILLFGVASYIYVPGPPFSPRVQIRLVVGQWVIGSVVFLLLASAVMSIRSREGQTTLHDRLGLTLHSTAAVTALNLLALKNETSIVRSAALEFRTRGRAGLTDEVRASEAIVAAEIGLPGPYVYPDPQTSERLNRQLSSLQADGLTQGAFPRVAIPSGLNRLDYAFVIAHEYAHVMGITNEGDANLIAAMVTLRSDDPRLVVSGWRGIATWSASSLGGDTSYYSRFASWIAPDARVVLEAPVLK